MDKKKRLAQKAVSHAKGGSSVAAAGKHAGDTGGAGKPVPTPESEMTFMERVSFNFLKVEVFGHKAANRLHRIFVNFMLLFIGWNMWVFVREYNNYWRLRRDSNIPKEWLEDRINPGKEDWAIERERIERESRIQR